MCRRLPAALPAHPNADDYRLVSARAGLLEYLGILIREVTEIMFYQTTYHSPIGRMLLIGDENRLVYAWHEGHRQQEAFLATCHPAEGDTCIFRQIKTWLDRYFDKRPIAIDPASLHLTGTPFQQAVWRRLLLIPYGRTATYGGLAREFAADRKLPHFSAQAIGAAAGRNPLAILIPCHRVIGKDGSLTGYAGGLAMKKWLLAHEGVNLRG